MSLLIFFYLFYARRFISFIFVPYFNTIYNMKTKNMKLVPLMLLILTFIGCKKEKKEVAEQQNKTVSVSTSGDKYMVDIEKSVINWAGSKPTGTHTGTLKLSNGTLTANATHLIDGAFLIDMNSITVTDLEGEMKDNLEAHLKGTVEGKEDHFFNVKKYPTAAFNITNYGKNAETGKMMLTGNLIIRDIKNSVSFPVTVTNENSVLSITSEPFTIDRTKWNINYGSKSVFDNLGDKFINDDMEIKISIIATKKE